jgi:formate hydrogenlyase transcriptional activator
MLADLSARLANVSAERVESEIDVAQVMLREFLGFDRSTFAEFQEDGSLVILSSTAAKGFEATPHGPLPDRLAWFMARLRSGQSLVIHDSSDLPPEALGEIEYLKNTGLRSHLSIPFRIGGRVIGAIAFSSFSKTRSWPDDLIARIKLVGEVFAHAIARKREQEKLASAVSEINELKDRLERENVYLRHAAEINRPKGLTSHSPSFRSVIDEVAQVAQTNSTVLLQGETGSGKEVLAQAIHNASSRNARPMVKVNCAALPASLIESELFGREKGAFTGALARQPGRFEIADGSTIFLDEIGELPLELQPKLLRVLQDGEFDDQGRCPRYCGDQPTA